MTMKKCKQRTHAIYHSRIYLSRNVSTVSVNQFPSKRNALDELFYRLNNHDAWEGMVFLFFCEGWGKGVPLEFVVQESFLIIQLIFCDRCVRYSVLFRSGRII